MANCSDERTRWTAGDSFVCKYHAVLKKYYDDPYAEAMYRQLTRKITALNMGRRTPLMNRGYYTRVLGFRTALDAFLAATEGKPRQFIYFGAGFDTAPMTSFDAAGSDTRVFEVDFPDIMARKLDMYQSDKKLSAFFSSQAEPPAVTDLSPEVRHIGRFSLVGVDLRSTAHLLQAMRAAGLQPNLPTLIFTECVLVYIDKRSVDALCSSMADFLESSAMWVTYDMINPHDRYGQVMVQNLTAAGFQIPGIHDYPTLDAESERFKAAGWSTAHSCTMRQFYDHGVTAAEKKRLKDLEIVDEVEEWNMIMDHYSLTIAVKNSASLEVFATEKLCPMGHV